ncbi:hypothetical protein L873DRAFT_1723352 [Choiromyces venosus 120613-1]|uniref:Integral membrane protein n=1 Tax=Choiromyces venosus 120613-1 TaxID=1336337 RepID=A0A3N4ISE7_9PEZI|nr:hypothetical protein L873DRAFT_1723352 [Choiromyces venosus 120613-1]
MSHFTYKHYPASASSRQPPYPPPQQYPAHIPQYGAPPYVPPPPPPPPTPPSQFPQSQYPPPGTQGATHNTQKRAPPVFERFNHRRGQSTASPPPLPPKIPDPNSSNYQYRQYPAPPSSVSSSSSSISSSSSHSSRCYGSSSSPNLAQLHLDDRPRRYGDRWDLNIRLPPRGYKPPSVESVPQSPLSLDTLSPDSKHVLDKNESYFQDPPPQEPVPPDSRPREESSPPLARSLRGGFTDGRLVNETPTEETKSWKEYPLPFYEGSDEGSSPNSPSESEHETGPESFVGSSPQESRPYVRTSPRTPPSTGQDFRRYSPTSNDAERIATPRDRRSYVRKGPTDSSPVQREPHSPSPRVVYQAPPTQPSPSQQVRQSPQLRYQTPPPLPVATRTPPPRQLPPQQVRRDLLPPPPRELLPVCPKRTPVSWGQWFQMSSVLNFDVCVNCYYTHIYPTLFAEHFHPVEKALNAEVSCAFSTERVLHRIWPNALERGVLNGLRDYALMRSNIPECSTVSGNPINGLSSRWWKVIDGSMPRFRCCDACYQDMVMATGFASYFAPANPQPEEEAWVCDLSFPFISGGMLSVSNYQDNVKDQWEDFVSVVRFRHNVPPCPGSAKVKSGERKWYIPKRPIPGLAICEACYCDNVIPHFEDKFTEAVAAPQQALMCGMASLAVKMPWDSAVQKGSFEIWWEAVYALMTLPQCSEKGFTDQVAREWYSLHHQHENLDNFKCCRSCYHSILRPLDLAPFFEPIRFPLQNPPSTRICSLAPDSPRYGAYIEKLREASNRRRFDIFLSYVIPRAKIPPCRPKSFLARTKWYGTDDFVVCEECYFEYVQNSPLNSQLTVRARYSPEHQACDLYSPRMKRIWEEACSKRDIKYFARAAIQRGEIYCEVLERSKAINEEIAARKAGAGRLTLYAPGSGSDGGYRYGRHGSGASIMDAESTELYKELEALQRRWKSVE